MRLKFSPYILIFVPLLGTFVAAELVNNQRLKDVLSDLNNIYFQQSRSSPFATANNTLCSQHFQIYLDQINVSYWAVQMLDSSAKLEAGILAGNLFSIGNFDECIGVTDVQTDLGPFSGKHCLAKLTWNNDTFLSTRKLITLPGVPNSMTLQWGFCIPSTCRAEDLVAGLSSILHHDVTVAVSELDCHTNKEKKLRAIDCVAIAVFIAFGLIVILSTSYDLFKKDPRKEILVAFSLYTNGRKMLDSKPSADTLTCLHGIRFLSICWVVLGHRYMLSMDVPSINQLTGYSYVKEWSSMIIVNSVLAVDTFLLLSGLLVAYVWLKDMERRQEKCFNIPLYYVHRYIRLTPPLAVMVLVQLSLIDHLGTGPLWDTTNNLLTEMCDENWWSALLYVQNYVSGNRMCVAHSWYLSVDMQLFWISPLILLPMFKWPRKWNLLLLGTLTIGGIVTSFVVTYVNRFPAGVMAGVGPEWAAKNQYEYVTTHTRCTPWIIGLGLGYLLHNAKNRKVRFTELQVCAGWLLAAVGFLGVLYGMLPFQQPDYVYDALESSMYNCLHRAIWSFAIGWIIFACVKGYGGPVNRFLSWGAFHPFGRLTYCIYLVHYPFMSYRQYTTRVPVYLNNINTMSQYFSDMVFSILLAALMSLVFELPAITIERTLLRRDGPQRNGDDDISGAAPKRSIEEGSINEGFAVQDR